MEVVQPILTRLSQGESLRSICRDKSTPSMSLIMEWLAKSDEFVEQYARAREIQADMIFDEIDEVARAAMNDAEAVNGARLFIDTQKWRLGKMSAKKYGDKQVIDVNANINVKGLMDDELDARIADFIPEAGFAAATGGTGVPAPAKRVRE